MRCQMLVKPNNTHRKTKAFSLQDIATYPLTVKLLTIKPYSLIIEKLTYAVG